MKKKYVIKIGQFYLKDIELDDNYPKTNFISEITLDNEYDPSNYYYKVSEDEQEQIREMLKLNLNLENEYDEITFEEVEE